MIFDKLENLGMYKDIPSLTEAIEYFETNDLRKLEFGTHKIEGKNFYIEAQNYVTENPEDKKAETHKEHIDLQILFDGRETIGYANINDCGEPVEANPDKDYWLYDTEVQDIVLTPGTFMILFPQDGHKSKVRAGKNCQVHKVVLKIRV